MSAIKKVKPKKAGCKLPAKQTKALKAAHRAAVARIHSEFRARGELKPVVGKWVLSLIQRIVLLEREVTAFRDAASDPDALLSGIIEDFNLQQLAMHLTSASDEAACMIVDTDLGTCHPIAYAESLTRKYPELTPKAGAAEGGGADG